MLTHDALLCHFRKMLLYTRVCAVVYSYLLPYNRKFWQEEYLADCCHNGIWWILLWQLGKPYTIIIFIAKGDICNRPIRLVV